MESEQKSLIYIEENDKAEASAQAKGFANNNVKNRAYINTLGVELGLKYLASEGINISNLHNLHSVHKFLEEFDIADIILPNVHIDIRVIFDEKFIFIPKSHFEFGLTPDIYLVFQLAEDKSHVKVLGFFEPKLINKNNANKDYYFIEKEKLTDISNLKAYIKNANNNTSQKLDDNIINSSETYFISMVDNDLGDNEKRNLIGTLLKSDELRDKFIEYSNFEILSYKATNEEFFKEQLTNTTEDLPEEKTPDLTPIAGITPTITDEIFTDEIPTIEENIAIEDEPQIALNNTPVIDEFELFDNKNSDEFDTIESSFATDSQNGANEISDLKLPQEESIENIIENPSLEDVTENQDDLNLNDMLTDMDEIDSSNEDNTLDDLLNEIPAMDDELQGNSSTPDLNTTNNEILFENQNEEESVEFISPTEELEEESSNDTNEILSYTNPAENEEQTELINFDDIDVSVTEDIDKYRNDDYNSATDAVAFDVLAPMNMDVDITNSSEDNEGNFITTLSADDGSISLDKLTPIEIKTDIIDEKITGIGSLDQLGSTDDIPLESFDSIANLSSESESSQKQTTKDIELNETIDNLPTIDTIDNFDNLNIEENIKPINDEEMALSSNLEIENNNELNNLDTNTIEELNDNTTELESLDNFTPIDSLEDIKLDNSIDAQDSINLQAVDDLNSNIETIEELNDNTSNLESLDNFTPIDSLEDIKLDNSIDTQDSINLQAVDDLNSNIETIEELNDNTSNLESLDNFTPIDNLEEVTLDKPIDEQESINLQAVDDLNSNIDTIEELNDNTIGLESLDSLTPIDSFEDITSTQTEQPVEIQHQNSTSSNDDDSSMSFDNVKPAEPNLSIIEEPPLSFENVKPAEPVHEKEEGLMSFATDLQIETTPKTTEKIVEKEELQSFDELPIINEIKTSNENNINSLDDMPFNLLDDNTSAPKPVNLETANLNIEEPKSKLQDELSKEISSDLSEVPAELNSKNILAEIDTLLGNNSEDEIEDFNEDDINNLENSNNVNFIDNSTEESQELSPEENIYMQTMGKEKGKKGLTLLLVLVAALMSLFTITTFVKGNKTANDNGFPTPPDGEILDTISNSPTPDIPEENIKVSEMPTPTSPKPQPSKESNIEQNTPKVEDIKPDIKKVENTELANKVVKGHFYPEVKKITFEIPDYLSYSDGIKKYLQTVGRSVKLSATSDLLLTSDYSNTDRVKVMLKLTPRGDIKSSNIEISSGSKQIDEIVLQSVKNTLDVVKPPADEVKGEEFNLAVIINF